LNNKIRIVVPDDRVIESQTRTSGRNSKSRWRHCTCSTCWLCNSN